MDFTDPITDLKWLIVIVVVIWIVWVITGGPSRYEAKNGFLLKPPSPLSTGQTYGQLPDIKLKLPNTLNVSLAQGQAALGKNTSLGETDPRKEYLEIVGQGGATVNITGWKLVGSNGNSVYIPQGDRVFVSGKVNKKEDIYLAAGEKAILVSGKSPVGDSFKVNSCSGYLSQFQDFTPALKDVCPSPILPDTLQKYPMDNTCIDYVNNMDSCEVQVSALPKNTRPVCRDFVFTHINYNQCVNDQRENADFQSDEWRVYLGSERELWMDHDTIKFYDRGGALMGTYTY